MAVAVLDIGRFSASVFVWTMAGASMPCRIMFTADDPGTPLRLRGPRRAGAFFVDPCGLSRTLKAMGAPETSPHDLARELSRLPKAKLVDCLVDLAASSDNVCSRVETLVAKTDPAKAASLVRTRLASLRRSTKHHWGFKGGATLSHALDEILDVIEKAILPADGVSALSLIASFIECDIVVFERADDSYGQLGDAFRRACTLFGAAAARVPSPQVLQLLQRLRADDGYGARGTLLGAAAAALDEPARTALIESCRRQACESKERDHHAGVAGLMDIADAIGDPELYEEGCNRSRHVGIPVHWLHVAQRYLRAGRAAEAFARMPATAEACGGHAAEWTATRIQILQALGQTDELRATLWRQFVESPAKTALDAWLAVVPEAERPLRLAQAREAVLSDTRDPARQVRFFLEQGEPDVAARCVLVRAGRFDGAHYDALKPLAEALAKTHPLAASLLYRSLLEGNLRPALSKYYSHGARYFRALEALAPRVEDWTPLAPHTEYVAALRSKHDRKVAFWARVDDPAKRP